MSISEPPGPVQSATFFVAGGTLRAGAACYVARKADEDLLSALEGGQFCYVLNSRQIGKSSLMANTMVRLQASGHRVAILDLTSIGRNVTLEQWYFGMLTALGSQLGARKALTEFWEKHGQYGPMQRWFEAVEHVLVRPSETRLTIFIDEIDYIRTLPFRTDEFFAAIRDCYNRRSRDPEFQRLTFCLLGVATPAELIADARMTPFNIGTRIELADFTEREAAVLAEGLGARRSERERALKRVLWWTGGHPYLTQRLCSAIAEGGGAHDSRSVDRACEQIFLSESAKTIDDNFAFVRHRLLNSAANPVEMLDLYDQVLTAKVVLDDEGNELLGLLKLTGVVKSVDGVLKVRNRLYARVFGRKWIKENLPEAETRRARRAFWKGLVLAGSVAVVITVVIGRIALAAVALEKEADKRAQTAIREQAKVSSEREGLMRQVYATKMLYADQEFRGQNLGKVRDILASLIPASGQPDYRGFEWRRLWRLTGDQSSAVLRGLKGSPSSVVVSRDGATIAAGGGDRNVVLWHLPDTAPATITRLTDPVSCLAISRDGKTLAAGGPDGKIRLLDVPTLSRTGTLDTGLRAIQFLAFYQKDKRLATFNADGVLTLWNVQPFAKLDETTLGGPAAGMAFSPDQQFLAASGLANRFHSALFKVEGGRKLHLIKTYPQMGGGGIAFSPNGKTVFVGDSMGRLFLMDVPSGTASKRLDVGQGGINSICAISDDSLFIGTTSREIEILYPGSGTRRPLFGHAEGVAQVAATGDRQTFVSASSDRTVRIWRDPGKAMEPPVDVAISRIRSLVFSKDGSHLLTGESDGTLTYRAFPGGRKLWSAKTGGNGLEPTAIDPGDRIVAGCSADGGVHILDAGSGRELRTLDQMGAPVVKVLFSPSENLFAVARLSGLVQLFDSGTWKFKSQFYAAHLPCELRDAAWSPKGDLMAFATPERGLFVYNMRDSATTLLTQQNHYSAVAFSHDGMLVAGGRMDGKVEIANLAKNLITEAEGTRAGAFESIAFSPDDKTIAGTGWGGSVDLWNVPAFSLVGTIPADRVVSRTVAFSPDGLYLVSGGTDRVLRMWRAAPGDPRKDPGKA